MDGLVQGLGKSGLASVSWTASRGKGCCTGFPAMVPLMPIGLLTELLTMSCNDATEAQQSGAGAWDRGRVQGRHRG